MTAIVFLRKVTAEDAADIVRWRNENSEGFPPGVVSGPLTIEDHLDWFHSIYEIDPADNMYVIGVMGIGYIGTVSLTVANGRGEIGRVILGEKGHARKGYMQTAIQQLISAFDLMEYWLRVKQDNFAAIKLYEKLGFAVEADCDDGYFVMDYTRESIV